MKKRKEGIPREDILVRKGVSYHAVQDTGLFKDFDMKGFCGNEGLMYKTKLNYY